MKKKFPYNLDCLTWDADHNRNIEDKYCYCGKGIKEIQPMIRCDNCKQLFHRDCIRCMVKPLLFGDTFGTFTCAVCTQGPETFQRRNLSWICIVHLVIYNLIKNAQIDDAKKPKKDKREHYYFRWKEDVCAFIDEYWDYLVPEKQRSLTWNNTIASVLSTHSNIFLSGLEKFHQSAWWTLHKIEPPSGEKKSKATAKIKPNLKKPLKRAKVDQDSTPTKPKNPKRLKKEVKEELDTDLLGMSSLSELSSADDSASDMEEMSTESLKKEDIKKNQALQTQVRKPSVVKTVTPEALEIEKSSSPSSPALVSSALAVLDSVSSLKPSLSKTTIHTETLNNELPLVTKDQGVIDKVPNVLLSQKPSIITANTNPTASLTPSTSTNPMLTPQDEWQLLQRLEHASKKLSPAACRYKRKLGLRRLKRNLGIRLFDMDNHIIQLLRQPKHPLEPISKETIIQPASNQQVEQQQDDQQQILDKILFTPYASSFASRLYGSIRQRHTITREEPWLSSWNGRKLRPFIRRDFQSKPKRMLLLGQIKACQGKPHKKNTPEPSGLITSDSIDYVYFQKEHLAQVNSLLSRSFWEGVDVSESLLFPEFSIVALYKRHVIGCAFMTPEAYITYFAVDPGWTNASIGQFMLYHLFQTAISKDITLHVSANNNAMILYQKFGFKPEEFIVNFYDKYLPADSVFSKNAFFLRLRR